MLRLLIVDDEPAARRRIKAMLRHVEGAASVGEAGDVEEALAATRRLRPDAILLDIDMPGASGVDLVGRLEGDERPSVVFVTAFDSYAVEAFGLAATDYLLKPVPLKRLREAIERVRAQRSAERRDKPPRAAPEAFWVTRRGMRQRVPLSEVLVIEADHDHVQLHTAQCSHLLRGRISEVERRLDDGEFIRIHRSAIVRRSHVQAVRQRVTGLYEVLLRDGTARPVGRTYAAAVRRLTRG